VVVLAVTVNAPPPPAVIGALHTLISVWSDAVKCVNSVYVFPAESVTPLALPDPELHVATSTMMRLPLVTGDVRVTGTDDPLPRCVDACCTNAGVTTLVGVTAFDAADAVDVPAEFVAVTVNV
jgi:hypothetical protein